MAAELDAPLQVNVAQRGTAVVVTLTGAADIEGATILRRRLLEAAPKATSLLVLDLGELSFICSTGLGALIEANKICRAAGVRLRLIDPVPVIRKIIETTRLNKLIEVYDTLDEGLEPPAD